MSEEKTTAAGSVSDLADPIEPENAGSENNDKGSEIESEISSSGSPQNKGGGGFTIAVAGLAILLALGGAFASYKLWIDLKNVEQEQQKAAGSLQKYLSETKDQLTQEQNLIKEAKDILLPFEGRLSQIEQDLNEVRGSGESEADVKQELLVTRDKIEGDLQALRKTLRQSLGSNQDAWRLAEVQFLLNVANQSLQLQRDPATAMAALVSASEQLLELGDPAYLSVRKQIARETASLKMLPQLDISGIALDISGLVQEVHNLPIEGAEYIPSEKNHEGSELGGSGESRDWEQLPGIVWNSIRELVQVRRQNEPVGIMIAPKEHYFLIQNLKLQLESARLSALRQDQENYKNSLLNIQSWLQEHFDINVAITKGMLGEVERLLKINVRPDLPDISQSSRILREIMVMNSADGTSYQDPAAPAAGVQAP